MKHRRFQKMGKLSSGKYIRFALPILLATTTAVFSGCVGEFTGGSRVSGLTYETETHSGKTDADGTFKFKADETITFSIGDLTLGSAAASTRMSPLNFTTRAAGNDDPCTANICALLQTLDRDGHLNNGIQITADIADIAGKYDIEFNQPAADFVIDADVTALITELNAAGVFADTDPRDRKIADPTAAREQLDRSLAERNTVNTGYGTVKGYAANEKTWQYLGIPYAKPPIGNLRWRPPQPPAAWKGIRDATAWGDQAAQNPALQRYGEGGMSEDCLYLNITAPKDAVNLPVMVWFHGGGFTVLTGNTKAFNNPAALSTKGVVQVVVNHRLGPFGYMAHPQLSAESGYGGSGNYGQMDLIMALKWVKANIAAFGGDPDNVTIFGESGGGRKVLSLMASPMAAGLFHKAISQSGTLIPDTRGLEAAQAYGTALSEALGAETLEELRAVKWTDIVTAAATAVVPYTNVDGRYLPTTERELIESGKHNDVPFMLVANTNDTPDPIRTWKNVLPWITDYSASNHYACLFSKVPGGWEDQGLLTYHGAELSYIFNYPQNVISHYQLGLVLDPLTGESLVIGDLNGNGITGSDGDSEDIFTSSGWDATDSAAADTAMTIWTNFAKTGDPGIAGVLDWPPYTLENDLYLDLGSEPAVKIGAGSVFP